MKENLSDFNYTKDDMKINFAIRNIYETIKKRVNEWYEENSNIVNEIVLNFEMPKEKTIELLECIRCFDLDYYDHFQFMEYYENWIKDQNGKCYESDEIVYYFKRIFDLPTYIKNKKKCFCDRVGHSNIINERIEQANNIIIKRIETELSILRDSLKEINEDCLKSVLGITEEAFEKIKTIIGI